MLLTLLATLLTGAQASSLGFDRIDATTAAGRVARCGFGPVTSRYDEDLQESVLVPTHAAGATDVQLACAEKAASFFDLDLPAPEAAKFAAIREARLQPIFAAEAQQRLARRGLRAPTYRRGVTSDVVFTRAVERRCGHEARGAFSSSYGPHALDPAWMARQAGGGVLASKTLACIIDMAMATGFAIDFIGNEAFAVDAPPGQPQP